MATHPAISQVGHAEAHSARPKILIVGAGLGGLALGMILQRTDTPYEIFERAPEIKPLGIYAHQCTVRALQTCISQKYYDTHIKLIFFFSVTTPTTGSITSLTGVTAPLFKQLGIWDEFRSLSKLLTTLQVITSPDLKSEFDVADVDDPIKR